MSPEEYSALSSSLNDFKSTLSSEIKDVRKEFLDKLDSMDAREIDRVKDLYTHIDNKMDSSVRDLKTELDKKTDKELFLNSIDDLKGKVNFIWKVLFGVFTIIGTAIVALIFEVFTG